MIDVQYNTATNIINEVAILDFSDLPDGYFLNRNYNIKSQVSQITLKGGNKFIYNVCFNIDTRERPLTIIL